MTSVSFSVLGTPQPQGNKSGYIRGGRVVMVEGRRPESRDAFKSWRAELAYAASLVAPPEPFNGPVSVTLSFRFLPTTSDPYKTHHSSSPDLDKLARAVFDSLKVGRVVTDDGRVASLRADKDYCSPGEMPGVDVTVEDLSELEAELRAEKKLAAKVARKAAAS